MRDAREILATLGRISLSPARAHGWAVLRMIRRPRHWTLHLLMLCALAAVITRALVPTGYMAVSDGDRISVILCGSGHAAALDLGDDEQPTQAGGEGVCVFAAAAAAAPPPATSASFTAPLTVIERPAQIFPEAVHVGLGLAAPPPPSHAPPVHV